MPLSRRGAVGLDLAEGGLATLLLLWPAMVQGHLLFGIDTARHIGFLDPPYDYSPPFYNLWLAPLWKFGQGWLVGAMQAGLNVALIAATVTTVGRKRPRGLLLAVAGVLALGTYLPTQASTAMPDVFAAVGLLAIGLGFLVRSRVSRAALAAVLWWAALVHYSHLPILAATWAVCAAAAVWIQRRMGGGGRVPIASTALALLLALATQVGANLAVHGRAAYSLAGSVFAVARLLEDGPAARYLERQCPQAGLRMCEVVEELPVNAQEFLWDPDSLVARSGGFSNLNDEASQVFRGTIVSFPGQVAAAMAKNTLRQLSWVTAFVNPRPPPYWYLAIGRRYPHVAKSLESPVLFAQHDPPRWSDRLHQGVFFVSLLALLALTAAAWRQGRSGALVFALTVIVGITVNAVITGGISGPFPRYAARVAWLVPLAAMAMAVATTGAQRERRSAQG